MKHKFVYLLAAIVLFIFGFLYLVAPVPGLKIYGYDVSAADLAVTIARYWGSAFVGLAFILWLGRKAQAGSIGVSAINYGGFAVSLSGLIVAVLDVIGGGPNALIWLTIALYAIFSVLFGLLVFKKK
jgi:hypothetical protein